MWLIERLLFGFMRIVIAVDGLRKDAERCLFLFFIVMRNICHYIDIEKSRGREGKMMICLLFFDYV